MLNPFSKIQKSGYGSLLSNKGRLTPHVKRAVLDSRIEGNRIYTKKWDESGRNISLTDHTFYVKRLLSALGYKYSEGNSEPKGGKEGDYIQCSQTAINTLLILVN